ncbi:MAG: exosortase family protein XrtF [Flavobacteriaceae bacterium]|nr:exosortase family protein XrtF [Flavobacteriaceae bacterium]
MKALLVKYKSVIRFVTLFIGSYLIFLFLYSVYLKYAEGGNYHPDYITHLVAKQSSSLLNSIGYEAEVVPHSTLTSMQLFINKQYLAEIVEGCNSISVIILFLSFVIAFAQNIKKTILFLFSGAVLVYAVNVIRIAFLAVALYKFPEYQEVLHSVVFPGIIYGMVFILWLIWIRIISNTATSNE